MRTTSIDIGGKPHMLCFSLRVQEQAEDKFGSQDALFDALTGDDMSGILRASVWLLARMMEAGKKYADMTGAECADPVDEDFMLDFFGLDDVLALVRSVRIAMAVSSKTDVDVETDLKNAETTQE